MTKPTLSVFIPNYNYGDYIQEALESVLDQSCSPSEVIVVDDCSTDNSVDVIEKLMKKHGNLRLLRNESNKGAIYSMNRGVDAAAGDYIYGIASDDRALPGLFEKSMDLLARYPQAALCCSDTSFLYDDGTYMEKKFYLSDKPRYFSPEDVIKLFLRQSFTPVRGNTAIVKRSVFLEAGGFNPELRWLCDSFADSVMCFRYGFCYVPEVFTVFRLHSGQYSGTNKEGPKLEREVVKNMLKILKTGEYSDVADKFKRTARFSDSSWEAMKVIIGNRQYRDFLTPALIKSAIEGRLRAAIKSILPAPLGYFARRIDNKVREIKSKALNRFRDR